jgi:hypothetical protein
VPHAPQFAGSNCRSVHDPAQSVWPIGHIETQRPKLQDSSTVHAASHIPQWAGLVARSTQTPPQLVRPAGHVHVPALQKARPMQAVPHAPQ